MYETRISRANPGLLILLVDHSYSMTDPLTGTKMRKIDAAAWATNQYLYNITQKCTGESKYKDYLEIAVISYGDKIESALEKIPFNELPTSVNQIVDAFHKEVDNPPEIEGEPGSPLEWINVDKDLGGRTPMKGAFQEAKRMIQKWIPNHMDSFPPIICNITDGMPNDINYDDEGFGSLIGLCQSIQELKTNDGNTIIANCHISDKELTPLVYPCQDDVEKLKDRLAPLMFAMSSMVPIAMRERGDKLGVKTKDCSRFFVYNADLGTFGRFIKFGTDPTND